MNKIETYKDWRFVTLMGLPELVCIFISSRTPNRLLAPALTTLANAYGCRQKDIRGMSVEAEWVGEDGGTEFNMFSAAYNGAYRLRPFELWSWDKESSALKLVRKSLETQQMSNASWASRNASDSKVDMRLPRWSRMSNVLLESLLPEECTAYYESELQKHESAGTVTGFRARSKDWSRPVVIIRRDANSFEIVGGKERVAQGLLDGNQVVTSVLVGDFADTAAREYDRRVANIAALESRAGPCFTFWQQAMSALKASAGDPFQVDWAAVDEAVLLESIKNCRQQPDSVRQVLLDNSPSAVFPDREQQIAQRAVDVARYVSWTVERSSDMPRESESPAP